MWQHLSLTCLSRESSFSILETSFFHLLFKLLSHYSNDFLLHSFFSNSQSLSLVTSESIKSQQFLLFLLTLSTIITSIIAVKFKEQCPLMRGELARHYWPLPCLPTLTKLLPFPFWYPFSSLLFPCVLFS